MKIVDKFGDRSGFASCKALQQTEVAEVLPFFTISCSIVTVHLSAGSEFYKKHQLWMSGIDYPPVVAFVSGDWLAPSWGESIDNLKNYKLSYSSLMRWSRNGSSRAFIQYSLTPLVGMLDRRDWRHAVLWCWTSMSYYCSKDWSFFKKTISGRVISHVSHQCFDHQ